jgi:hypothetical protein
MRGGAALSVEFYSVVDMKAPEIFEVAEETQKVSGLQV